MVSDSRGCCANWWRDAFRCPDCPGIMNKCQMNIFKASHKMAEKCPLVAIEIWSNFGSQFNRVKVHAILQQAIFTLKPNQGTLSSSCFTLLSA